MTRIERIEKTYLSLLENRTEYEKALSESLRERHLIFYEQFYVETQNKKGAYLDFYFPILRLAVELDGSYHSTDEQRQKDHQRDKLVSGLGIKTLRIFNSTISDPESLAAFSEDIYNAVSKHSVQEVRNLFSRYDKRENVRYNSASSEEKGNILRSLVHPGRSIIVLPCARLPKAVYFLLKESQGEWVRVSYTTEGHKRIKTISPGGGGMALTEELFEKILATYKPKRKYVLTYEECRELL